jgi:protein-serine/threonine kinase
MENDGGANANNANNGNNNRLFLNFNNNADRFSPTDRSYPTTPSTFPQPVFQAQGQSHQGQSQPQQQQNGYTPAQGYFMNNPYPTNNQQSNQYQPGQQGYAQPSYQSRGAVGTTDPATNGLVHQFSHQNLGGAARGNQYGARQPSPSQRPRTAGATGLQQNYHGYAAPSAPAVPQQPEFEPAPERNPDKYGTLTHNNQKRCAQLASDFFKDSVKRARDRNLR